MASSDFCGECKIVVRNGDPALECGGPCKRWFHLGCNTGWHIYIYMMILRLRLVCMVKLYVFQVIHI